MNFLDSNGDFMFYLNWGLTIGYIVSLVLLIYQVKWAWLILLVESLWNVFGFYFLYGDDNFFGLSRFEYFISISTIANLLLSGFLIWGFIQWLKKTNQTQIAISSSSDVLDDFGYKTITTINKLSTDSIKKVVRLGGLLLIGLIAWSTIIEGDQLGYTKISICLIWTLYIIGFYLLSQHYREGWFLLIGTILLSNILLGFSLRNFTFYWFLKLALATWGYIYWKRLNIASQE
ncbi:MAG: hypothetical protein GY810_10965 [Aureispira sp.]|nr:hypothetical protein [Aureispira sp.]